MYRAYLTSNGGLDREYLNAFREQLINGMSQRIPTVVNTPTSTLTLDGYALVQGDVIEVSGGDWAETRRSNDN